MHRMLVLSVVAGVLCLPATDPGELRRLHEEAALGLDYDASRSRSYEQATSSAHGVSEISIERDPGPFEGPSYTAVLSSDGAIRFVGRRHPRREGVFAGTAPRWQFDALAQFVVESGYMDYEHTYTARVFDLSTVYTSVVHRGERRVIRHDARAGPSALWAMEQILDKLLDEADWHRVGDLPTPATR
jgi:hypothetical protein